ncbi:MAG: phosphatase PAP2 family protein [Candidatus Ancillula sp.]|jgi:membrane-associated phospholipid phosphatase|nr:phosphatase PAP2 family protein [Candidatus Ancillula sp.]
MSIISKISQHKVIVCAAILAFLMLTGTFFDFQIAQAVVNQDAFFPAIVQIFFMIPYGLLLFLLAPIAAAFFIRMPFFNNVTKVAGVIACTIYGFAVVFVEAGQDLDEYYIIQKNLNSGKKIGFPSSNNDVAGNPLFTKTEQMTVTLIVFLLLAILSYIWLSRVSEKRLKQLLIVALLGTAFALITETYLVDEFIKPLFGRARPYQVFGGEFNGKDGIAYTPWWQINFFTGNKSFPSGHTACFWTSAFFVYFVDPKNLLLRRVTIGLVILGGVFTALGRMVYGCHFLSDVTMSVIIVAGIAYLFGRILEAVISSRTEA